MKLKSNNPHHWLIILAGFKRNQPRSETRDFKGTFDEALAYADEWECEVPFDVAQVIVTRGKRIA